MMSTRSEFGMFNPMLEVIFKERVFNTSPLDEGLSFMLEGGSIGTVERNIFNGSWEVYEHGEFVYMIEPELEPILEHKDNNALFDTYEYVNTLDFSEFQYKSRQFLEHIKESLENLLIHGHFALTGRAKIGAQEVIYKDKKKFLISLN